MGAMGKLRVFVVQEPVVAASCLIAGFGIPYPPSPQDCSSVVSIGHEQSVSLVSCPKLLPRLECHGGGKEDPHRVSATQRTLQATQLPQVRESGLAVKRGKRRRDWV
uniref:Uncharacterized protein n=1 Tax=Oryza nivara TaxID=4536 RepID=A0A0E0FRW1_ORYNI